MIIEELERLLLEEGWYLHKWEVMMLDGRVFIKGIVGFSDTPYTHFGFFDDNTLTAKKILVKIKEYIDDKKED